MIKEIFKRWGLESPSFFKKVMNIAIILVGVASALIGFDQVNPDVLHEDIIKASNYIIAIGLAIGITAKTTVKDPKKLEDGKQ